MPRLRSLKSSKNYSKASKQHKGIWDLLCLLPVYPTHVCHFTCPSFRCFMCCQLCQSIRIFCCFFFFTISHNTEMLLDELFALQDSIITSNSDNNNGNPLVHFETYWQIGKRILTDVSPYFRTPYADITPQTHVQTYLQQAMSPMTVDGEAFKNFEQTQNTQAQKGGSTLRLKSIR